jgi:tRNA A-37 threonylcarbamoyl transferase component Bud32
VNNVILGTTLGGRYRLDARIGHGGMSTVYRAFDTVLERQVAIKLMHREIASDSDQLERFRREARAVAQLNHPHIVTVIDAGEWDTPGEDDLSEIEGGTPYMVLEHVAGETLKELIRRDAPLDAPTVLAYAIEIARALGAAHAQEIVHRDVKPQNVLLGGEGGAKITDFGIARTLSEVGLTMDGRVLGTTDYVSPEQALGQGVTGQSDVYSLGVVMYEMLTGQVPFKGQSPVAVAMMHVREEVPDVQLARPEVTAATAVVVERATAKDLDRRYTDMTSMIADMEEALAIETARAGGATGEVTAVLRTLHSPARRLLPWRVRHPARWVVSLVLLAAIVAGTLIAAADHTHSGAGVVPDVRASGGVTPVVLAQNAASSYNPFGTGPEHAEDVASVVDGDINTSWSTEHYIAGSLGKPGLGVSIDAAPGVAARAIEIQTPTPGFTAGVYAATGLISGSSSGEVKSLTALGWTPLAASRAIGARTRISIDSSRLVYRYYLVWITKLPPGSETAEISEITLFR